METEKKYKNEKINAAQFHVRTNVRAGESTSECVAKCDLERAENIANGNLITNFINFSCLENCPGYTDPNRWRF